MSKNAYFEISNMFWFYLNDIEIRNIRRWTFLAAIASWKNSKWNSDERDAGNAMEPGHALTDDREANVDLA